MSLLSQSLADSKLKAMAGRQSFVLSPPKENRAVWHITYSDAIMSSAADTTKT
jgi:hypothetical protein